MISVSEYVTLKILLARRKVDKNEVYNFIIGRLPMEARLMTNASPYEVYEEFDAITTMLETKRCIERKDDTIELISDECEKNLRKYVKILEDEAEKVTPSLDGMYIAIVKPLIDQYTAMFRYH